MVVKHITSYREKPRRIGQEKDNYGSHLDKIGEEYSRVAGRRPLLTLFTLVDHDPFNKSRFFFVFCRICAKLGMRSCT